jgi:hypothetical protein
VLAGGTVQIYRVHVRMRTPRGGSQGMLHVCNTMEKVSVAVANSKVKWS